MPAAPIPPQNHSTGLSAPFQFNSEPNSSPQPKLQISGFLVYWRVKKRDISYRRHLHSRPQRPRSFWSAPRIATSGLVQRHSGFEWLWKHNRLRPEPIRFVRLDSEHAQSDGKSVNRGLPVLDQARGRDSWCWPKGARPLGTRMRHLLLRPNSWLSLPSVICNPRGLFTSKEKIPWPIQTNIIYTC